MSQEKTKIIVPAHDGDPYRTRHVSEPAVFEEETGARFGDCIIERPLGMGGAAAVYLAKHQQLEVLRAIKVLKGQFRNDSQFKKRFLKEAKLVAGLDHPAIVRIHTVGEVDGKPFIEMEWIDGVSLRRLLEEKGVLPPSVASAIAEQVAQALAYAHTASIGEGGGIVHRDIKPENILIQKDGRIKLVDFGIARSMESSNDTVAGTIIGTLHYMSPEQIDGKTADARSDIYSLTVVLYEMLTGFAPFTAATFTAIVKKITDGRYVPLKRVNASIGPGLSRIVRAGLQPLAGGRFQTAARLVEELAALRKPFRLDPDRIVREWLSTGKAPLFAHTAKRIRYILCACLLAAIAGVYLFVEHKQVPLQPIAPAASIVIDSAKTAGNMADTLRPAVQPPITPLVSVKPVVRTPRAAKRPKPVVVPPEPVQSACEIDFNKALALDQRYRRGEVELRDSVRSAWQAYIKEYGKEPAAEKFVSDAKKRLLYIINN